MPFFHSQKDTLVIATVLKKKHILIPPHIKHCCFFTRRDSVEGAGIPSSVYDKILELQ